jgi:hypothetical protein
VANDRSTVARTLHLRMRTTAASATPLLSIVKGAIPFYEASGGGRVRLLRNVDDPGQFVQVIEYEVDETLEFNRQRIASDPAIQAYLMAWRSLLAGAVEIDVYEDVTEST